MAASSWATDFSRFLRTLLAFQAGCIFVIINVTNATQEVRPYGSKPCRSGRPAVSGRGRWSCCRRRGGGLVRRKGGAPPAHRHPAGALPPSTGENSLFLGRSLRPHVFPRIPGTAGGRHQRRGSRDGAVRRRFLCKVRPGCPHAEFFLAGRPAAAHRSPFGQVCGVGQPRRAPGRCPLLPDADGARRLCAPVG